MRMSDHKLNILLVDDEPGIRNVLRLSLSDLGYVVETAPGGAQAIASVKRNPPQVVLTDIKMPGIDGIDLLKTIKQIQPGIEVIMMTGHGDMDLAIQSLKFGAMDFITKPINETILEMALDRSRERITMRAQLDAYTRRLEQMVEEKSRQLVDAERLAAIGETVAGLSHAIKNITGGLKGGAFVVEKGFEMDNRQYLLEGWHMVRSNVEKIGRLSLDMLNYAKTATLDCQWCDPNLPVEEIVALMSPRAEEEDISLDIQLAPKPEPVYIDPDAIHRALLNLVTNALEACQASASAQVGLAVVPDKSGGLAYLIRDNGHGMDEAVRQRLFTGFFSTKGDAGNGIGLMMTKNIIEKHGGSIAVRSQKGRGALFEVQLPARQPKEIDPVQSAAKTEEMV